jgi:hypothetical protein
MRMLDVEILDIRRLSDGTYEGLTERYTTESLPSGPNILWGATRAPRGWRRVGEGVAYLAQPDKWNVVRATVRMDQASVNRLVHQDCAHPDGMVLIVILPEGYVTKDDTALAPKPLRAKTHKGRMALLWELRDCQPGAAFELTSAKPSEVEAMAEELNTVLVTPRLEANQSPPTRPPEVPEILADPAEVEKPKDATDWILQAASTIPQMVYLIGVVGLVAAAAVAIVLSFGYWQYALFGAVAIFVMMVVVRIYATTEFSVPGLDISRPAMVFVWTSVLAFVALVFIGIAAVGVMTYQQVFPRDSTSGGTRKAATSRSLPSRQSDATEADGFRSGDIGTPSKPPPPPPRGFPSPETAGVKPLTEQQRASPEFAATKLMIRNETSKEILVAFTYRPYKERNPQIGASDYVDRFMPALPAEDTLERWEENFGGPVHVSVLTDEGWMATNEWLDLGVVTYRTVVVTEHDGAFSSRVEFQETP